MSARIPPWPRPHFRPGGAAASIEFVCIADKLLEPEGDPGKYWDWSPYAERPEGLVQGFMTREDAPDWFDWLTEGPVRPDGPRCEPERRAERAKWLPAATHVFRVAVDVVDPQDLGYLQAAWATVRWYVEAGAYAVFDAKAVLWHSHQEIAGWLGPQRFSLRREIRIDYEKLRTPENCQLISTCGMVKFGRPELVYVMSDLTPAQIEWGKYFFEGIASEMALGRRFDANEDGSFEGRRFHLGVYEPNVNAPDLEIEGDAVIVHMSWNRDE